MGQGSDLEEKDIEKEPTSSRNSEVNSWGLGQTLRGTKDKDNAVGIKSERVGLMWEGLTVRGVEGLESVVRTLSESFVLLQHGWNGDCMSCDMDRKEDDSISREAFEKWYCPTRWFWLLEKPGSGYTTSLKHFFGYVQPCLLTALMGVSGADKTREARTSPKSFGTYRVMF